MEGFLAKLKREKIVPVSLINDLRATWRSQGTIPKEKILDSIHRRLGGHHVENKKN